MKKKKASKRSRKTSADRVAAQPDDEAAMVTEYTGHDTSLLDPEVPTIEESGEIVDANEDVAEQMTPAASFSPPAPPTEAATMTKPVVSMSRSEAARRTAAGKFNRIVFNQIGGTDVPNYAKLTWTQRDAIHEKHPEVKARYNAHLASMKK